MSLKMRGEVLDELIKRLRSGQYKQGQSALRSRVHIAGEPDRFCCLGVLCEMAEEARVVDRLPADPDDGTYWYSNGNSEDGNNIYLPDSVVDWAGIVSDIEKEQAHNEYYYEQKGQFGEGKFESLAVMNDDGMPFSNIADWLEANVVRV